MTPSLDVYKRGHVSVWKSTREKPFESAVLKSEPSRKSMEREANIIIDLGQFIGAVDAKSKLGHTMNSYARKRSRTACGHDKLPKWSDFQP